MSSEYEKQLEEANQKLRERLEKETARADALEKKLKANNNVEQLYNTKYETKILKEYYDRVNKDAIESLKSYKFMFQKDKP
jgi:regulator of replication initiation timing